MEILTRVVSKEYLKTIAADLYVEMVKAVADVDRGLIAIDAELHSDLESFLLQNGSDHVSLWGFNIYPDMEGDDFIEFDSLINIRPRQNNRSRYVENPEIRSCILSIISQYIR